MRYHRHRSRDVINGPLLVLGIVMMVCAIGWINRDLPATIIALGALICIIGLRDKF